MQPPHSSYAKIVVAFFGRPDILISRSKERKFIALVVNRITHRSVEPTLAGSLPVECAIFTHVAQLDEHQPTKLIDVGSNPIVGARIIAGRIGIPFGLINRTSNVRFVPLLPKMQDWYIDCASAFQADERGLIPLSCSNRGRCKFSGVSMRMTDERRLSQVCAGHPPFKRSFMPVSSIGKTLT